MIAAIKRWWVRLWCDHNFDTVVNRWHEPWGDWYASYRSVCPKCNKVKSHCERMA